MKFHRDDKRKIRANLELTPLIDVVFQLLIFFMLTSTFVVQTSIPIEASESKDVRSGGMQRGIWITLEFSDSEAEIEGRISIQKLPDGVRTSLDSLEELDNLLVNFYDDFPNEPVMIAPDRRVPTGLTVKVLGLVASSGFEQYSIYAEQPSESE